jgi:hypothetical protein
MRILTVNNQGFSDNLPGAESNRDWAESRHAHRSADLSPLRIGRQLSRFSSTSLQVQSYNLSFFVVFPLAPHFLFLLASVGGIDAPGEERT